MQRPRSDHTAKLVRATAPDQLPVSAEEALYELRQDLLNIDDEDEKKHVERKIEAATQEVDGRDGWLGRALITQSWDLILPGFPTEQRLHAIPHLWNTVLRRGESEITIPLPPLQEVESITFKAPDGTTKELSDYRVIQGEPARILPEYGRSWPATREDPDAVVIRFKAGYGDIGEDIPAIIREYILASVVSSYDVRGMVVVGTITAQVPHVRHMLESYRVHGALPSND